MRNTIVNKYDLGGTSVAVKDRYNLGVALKLFKRKIKESGKLNEYRENQQYVKPTTKRRAELNRAKYLQSR